MLGHRQAFAWIDDWHNMTIEDVRAYESSMQDKTNVIVQQAGSGDMAIPPPQTPTGSKSPSSPHTPTSPKTPDSAKKSLFSWF